MYKNFHQISCDNTYGNKWQYTDKSCKLKLNYINYHVYYHIKFGTNFDTQFSVLSIIKNVWKPIGAHYLCNFIIFGNEFCIHRKIYVRELLFEIWRMKSLILDLLKYSLSLSIYVFVDYKWDVVRCSLHNQLCLSLILLYMF